MAYYLRSLCIGPTASRAPDELLSELRDRGFGLEIQLEAESANPLRNELTFMLENGAALEISVISREGPESDLFREEVDEFEESVEDADASARDFVLEHLRRTEVIFAVEIPASARETGLAIGREVLDILTASCSEALMQADGEGFYDRRGNLLVAEE